VSKGGCGRPEGHTGIRRLYIYCDNRKCRKSYGFLTLLASSVTETTKNFVLPWIEKYKEAASKTAFNDQQAKIRDAQRDAAASLILEDSPPRKLATKQRSVGLVASDQSSSTASNQQQTSAPLPDPSNTIMSLPPQRPMSDQDAQDIILDQMRDELASLRAENRELDKRVDGFYVDNLKLTKEFHELRMVKLNLERQVVTLQQSLDELRAQQQQLLPSQKQQQQQPQQQPPPIQPQQQQKQQKQKSAQQGTKNKASAQDNPSYRDIAKQNGHLFAVDPSAKNARARAMTRVNAALTDKSLAADDVFAALSGAQQTAAAAADDVILTSIYLRPRLTQMARLAPYKSIRRMCAAACGTQPWNIRKIHDDLYQLAVPQPLAEDILAKFKTYRTIEVNMGDASPSLFEPSPLHPDRTEAEMEDAAVASMGYALGRNYHPAVEAMYDRELQRVGKGALMERIIRKSKDMRNTYIRMALVSKTPKPRRPKQPSRTIADQDGFITVNRHRRAASGLQQGHEDEMDED
jgi:hypothetical protein